MLVVLHAKYMVRDVQTSHAHSGGSLTLATVRHPNAHARSLRHSSVNRSCVARIRIREVGRRERARNHRASESAAQRETRLAN